MNISGSDCTCINIWILVSANLSLVSLIVSAECRPRPCTAETEENVTRERNIIGKVLMVIKHPWSLLRVVSLARGIPRARYLLDRELSQKWLLLSVVVS